MKSVIKSMNRPFKTFWFSAILLLVLALNLTTTLAQEPNKLTITISPVTIRQGESYTLTASYPDGSNYGGQLDYNLRLCNYSNPQSCTNSTGEWLTVTNGQITVQTTKDFGLGYYYVSFKPHDQSSFSWSDEDLSLIAPYDMSKFWNLKTGNYWVYQGQNTYTDTPFSTKVEIETSQVMCNKTVYPWRLTKSATEGYWAPADPIYSLNTNIVHRWFLVPFEKLYNWPSDYLWSLGYKVYNRDSSHPIEGLSQFNSSYENILFTSKPANRESFPPYILSPKFLDLKWSFSKTSNQQAFEYFVHPIESDFCKEYKVEGLPNDRIWYNSWHLDFERIAQISTPAYTGPALRVRFFENNLREDWYLAENIGVIKIAVKYFPLSVKDFESCTGDPDCNSIEISNPTAKMSLEKAYLGEPLQIRLNKHTLTPEEYYTANITYHSLALDKDFPYHGYLEERVNDTNYFLSNNFISDGTQTFQATDKEGSYTMLFRRWVPSNNTGSTLPWSDNVNVTVAIASPTLTPTPTPIPGDVDGNGRVDGLDVIYLISHLGNLGACPACDLDRNGRVDGLDVIMLIGYL